MGVLFEEKGTGFEDCPSGVSMTFATRRVEESMDSTMMSYPLTLAHILERAGKIFPRVEVVSHLPGRSLHRYTYRDFYTRARALAGALEHAGLQSGDRVATLMWNHSTHLEAYYGIPIAGGIVHTLNLRLPPDDLAFIANHAEDRFLMVDDVLLPLYEKFKSDTRFERVIVVALTGKPIPPEYQDYEAFLGDFGDDFVYKQLDENQGAAMCYTSGTTGKPKGVIYSHRSLVLHSLAIGMTDSLGISERDVILPVVPMFHVNAWGIPFLAPMIGAKLVLPGPFLDPGSLLDLFVKERVTCAAGVPTVWLAIVEALEKQPGVWKVPGGLRLLVGGSAPPESLIRRLDGQGLRLIHAWGLTESTPVATVSRLMPHMEDWTEDEKYVVRCRQGRPLPFVEVRALGSKGEVPWDGKTVGEVQLRGPWIASTYYNLPGEQGRWTADGWFRTGDIASIDSEAYVRISDRAKDLIKSGGEWISSQDLENALVAHPAVGEAAVIAVPHPRWMERPLGVIVLREGCTASAPELREFLAPKFAKWQLPDAFVFVKEIPRTSTGKMLKSRLREQFKNWEWQSQ